MSLVPFYSIRGISATRSRSRSMGQVKEMTDATEIPAWTMKVGLKWSSRSETSQSTVEQQHNLKQYAPKSQTLHVVECFEQVEPLQAVISAPRSYLSYHVPLAPIPGHSTQAASIAPHHPTSAPSEHIFNAPLIRSHNQGGFPLNLKRFSSNTPEQPPLPSRNESLHVPHGLHGISTQGIPWPLQNESDSEALNLDPIITAPTPHPL
ncbi:hypothetical protein AMTR_s00012p00154040 [Amborella trichopoda]|uniref:Uncharacterized protein n=1 Tax=Amborella trichopoda TaxID=13333 RepID=W1PII1_AMBTC|nr:hypothetical protein AMTR_s00012p00154040 [Amborella trichopoda]